MSVYTVRGFLRACGLFVCCTLVFGVLTFTVRVTSAQEVTAPVEQTPTPSPFPTQAIHFVGYGETLLSIARYYRVTIIALAQANQISDPNTIYIGQRLLIPPAPTATLTQSPADVMNTAVNAAASVAANTVLIDTPIFTPTLIPPTVEIPTLSATLAFFTADTMPTPLPTSTAAIPTALMLNLPTSTQLPFVNVPTEPTSVNNPLANAANQANIPLTAANAPNLPPTTVNGIPINQIIVMDDRVQTNIRAIYEIGQILGRNPNAFSKVGDSTIENPFFMDRFDRGDYNLGDYAYLQPVIDFYRGSFARDSIAVRVGLHSWSVLDPMWADPYQCRGGESMLACEIRIHNPSVLIIRLGSNDAGIPRSVDRSLRGIVDFCIMNGIIPILGTKADRFDGANSPNNQIIRQIATDYGLLLWEYDLIAGTLPNRGLTGDGVHMNFTAHDYTQPSAFRFGHSVHSLTGLMALEAVMNVIQQDSP